MAQRLELGNFKFIGFGFIKIFQILGFDSLKKIKIK